MTKGLFGRGFFRRVFSCRKQGETLRAFSLRTKIPYSSLRGWRNGASPRTPTIVRVGRILDRDPRWLCFGDPKDLNAGRPAA